MHLTLLSASAAAAVVRRTNMKERLRDRGEIALLEEIRRLVPAGAGVRSAETMRRCCGREHPLLLTIDCARRGRALSAELDAPRELGRRAFHVAASPTSRRWAERRASCCWRCDAADLPFAELSGDRVRLVRDAASRRRRALVGGNLTPAAISRRRSAMLGDAPDRAGAAKRRARVGDRLYVTGPLGGAALGVRLLRLRARARTLSRGPLQTVYGGRRCAWTPAAPLRDCADRRRDRRLATASSQDCRTSAERLRRARR